MLSLWNCYFCLISYFVLFLTKSVHLSMKYNSSVRAYKSGGADLCILFSYFSINIKWVFYFDVENIISKMTQSGCSWITLHVKSSYWRLHHHFWTGLKNKCWVLYLISNCIYNISTSFLYRLQSVTKFFLLRL